jgi:hypothetical protein
MGLKAILDKIMTFSIFFAIFLWVRCISMLALATEISTLSASGSNEATVSFNSISNFSEQRVIIPEEIAKDLLDRGSSSSSGSFDVDIGDFIGRDNSSEEVAVSEVAIESENGQKADMTHLRQKGLYSSSDFAKATIPSSSLVLNSKTAPLTALSPAPSTLNSTKEDQGNDTSTPSVTPADTHGVPSNPTDVIAIAYEGKAEVSWKMPLDDGGDLIVEYELACFDEETSEVVATQTVAPLAASNTTNLDSNDTTGNVVALVPTSLMVTHLLNGRSYSFKVRAKNKNGYSTWSAKSAPVSPLHPPDLCGRISCSGHGTCFPNYLPTTDSLHHFVNNTTSETSEAKCICQPGYSPPDCSIRDDAVQFAWKVTAWSSCSSGCGGGKTTREAYCFDFVSNEKATSDELCNSKKPVQTGICNSMECGSKLVSVKYQVEMSYDEVLFNAESYDSFVEAFTTEVSAALQISRSRLEVVALKRGSIVVYFQILPPARLEDKSLNDIVETLQDELGNSSSTLRSKGTFARHVELHGVKLSFSIADQTVAGGAQDISIVGLIGTVFVLVFVVSLFGWFLRRRHHRMMASKNSRHHDEEDDDRDERAHKKEQDFMEAPRSKMKRMGIRTMT